MLLKSEATTAWTSCHLPSFQLRRNSIHSKPLKARDTERALPCDFLRTTALPSTLIEDHLFVPDTFVPLILIIALSLGFAANGWINQLLKGHDNKSGLGAFLKDGSGYNRSGYTMRDSDRAVQSDPLPWLKLPKFDFVEVAGQEKSNIEVMLERLRLDLNTALANGDRVEAKRIERELESMMNEAGIEFETEK